MPETQRPAPAEIRSIRDLRPQRRNSNRGTKRGADLLSHSIQQYGLGRGICVDRKGEAIAGSHVLEEAVERGFEVVVVPTDGRTLVVTQRTDLDLDTDRAAVELAYADNRTQQVGFDLDPVIVAEDITAGVDLSRFYFEDELADVLKGLRDEAAPATGGATDAPPARVTDIQPGQLFALGAHRLICGDTTDPALVARLVGDSKIALVHADPPYGMGKEAEGIANDNLYGPKLDAFQLRWWNAWLPFMADNASAYLWGNAPDLWRLWYVGGLAGPDLLVRNEIVWDKGSANGIGSRGSHNYPQATERALFLMRGQQMLTPPNQDDFAEEFEPLRSWLEAERNRAGWTNADVNGLTETAMATHWFTRSQFIPISWKHYDILQRAACGRAFTEDYDDLFERLFGLTRSEVGRAVRAKYRSYFDNAHTPMTDVWSFPRVVGEDRYGHATPKPVDLVARAIRTSCPPDAVVAAPFAGTGPEIIAAEQLGRRCVAVDLEPTYCQIIIDRWEAFTGQKAERLA